MAYGSLNRLTLPRRLSSHSKSRSIAGTLAQTTGSASNSVGIQELDTVEYAIDRWDDRGLIASYGGNESDPSTKCQRHVLTMDFESGAVSVSDIPTHMKGCEAFTVTDSYRLVRGEYYVDTTPNNDGDKPPKKSK
jgi:hypothetical protein